MVALQANTIAAKTVIKATKSKNNGARLNKNGMRGAGGCEPNSLESKKHWQPTI
jgi:hypothetical protein